MISSKLPARAASNSFAGLPVGVISAETRTPGSRTALATPLPAHCSEFVPGELEALLFRCGRDLGPKISKVIDTEVASQRLLDHLRIALAGSRSLDLDRAKDILIERDSGAGLRHNCIIAS